MCAACSGELGGVEGLYAEGDARDTRIQVCFQARRVKRTRVHLERTFRVSVESVAFSHLFDEGGEERRWGEGWGASAKV